MAASRTFTLHLALVDGSEDEGEEGDDALEEEVEEEERAGAADQPVEHEEDLSRRRARRRHPKPCGGEINRGSCSSSLTQRDRCVKQKHSFQTQEFMH